MCLKHEPVPAPSATPRTSRLPGAQSLRASFLTQRTSQDSGSAIADSTQTASRVRWRTYLVEHVQADACVARDEEMSLKRLVDGARWTLKARAPQPQRATKVSLLLWRPIGAQAHLRDVRHPPLADGGLDFVKRVRHAKVLNGLGAALLLRAHSH